MVVFFSNFRTNIEQWAEHALIVIQTEPHILFAVYIHFSCLVPRASCLVPHARCTLRFDWLSQRYSFVILNSTQNLQKVIVFSCHWTMTCISFYLTLTLSICRSRHNSTLVSTHSIVPCRLNFKIHHYNAMHSIPILCFVKAHHIDLCLQFIKLLLA